AIARAGAGCGGGHLGRAIESSGRRAVRVALRAAHGLPGRPDVLSDHSGGVDAPPSVRAGGRARRPVVRCDSGSTKPVWTGRTGAATEAPPAMGGQPARGDCGRIEPERGNQPGAERSRGGLPSAVAQGGRAGRRGPVHRKDREGPEPGRLARGYDYLERVATTGERHPYRGE